MRRGLIVMVSTLDFHGTVFIQDGDMDALIRTPGAYVTVEVTRPEMYGLPARVKLTVQRDTERTPTVTLTDATWTQDV